MKSFSYLLCTCVEYDTYIFTRLPVLVPFSDIYVVNNMLSRTVPRTRYSYFGVTVTLLEAPINNPVYRYCRSCSSKVPVAGQYIYSMYSQHFSYRVAKYRANDCPFVLLL